MFCKLLELAWIWVKLSCNYLRAAANVEFPDFSFMASQSIITWLWLVAIIPGQIKALHATTGKCVSML